MSPFYCPNSKTSLFITTETEWITSVNYSNYILIQNRLYFDKEKLLNGYKITIILLTF